MSSTLPSPAPSHSTRPRSGSLPRVGGEHVDPGRGDVGSQQVGGHRGGAARREARHAVRRPADGAGRGGAQLRRAATGVGDRAQRRELVALDDRHRQRAVDDRVVEAVAADEDDTLRAQRAQRIDEDLGGRESLTGDDLALHLLLGQAGDAEARVVERVALMVGRDRPRVEQRHGAEARPGRRGREVGALAARAEVQRAAEGAARGRGGHRRRPGRRGGGADGVGVVARVAGGDGDEDARGVGVEGRGLGRVDPRRVVRGPERQVDDVHAVAHGGVDRADDVHVRAIAHLPARLVDRQVRAGRHAGDAVDAERVAVDAGVDAGVADGDRGDVRPMPDLVARREVVALGEVLAAEAIDEVARADELVRAGRGGELVPGLARPVPQRRRRHAVVGEARRLGRDAGVDDADDHAVAGLGRAAQALPQAVRQAHERGLRAARATAGRRGSGLGAGAVVEDVKEALAGDVGHLGPPAQRLGLLVGQRGGEAGEGGAVLGRRLDTRGDGAQRGVLAVGQLARPRARRRARGVELVPGGGGRGRDEALRPTLVAGQRRRGELDDPLVGRRRLGACRRLGGRRAVQRAGPAGPRAGAPRQMGTGSSAAEAAGAARAAMARTAQRRRARARGGMQAPVDRGQGALEAANALASRGPRRAVRARTARGGANCITEGKRARGGATLAVVLRGEWAWQGC